jgi:hypothetical protein
MLHKSVFRKLMRRSARQSRSKSNRRASSSFDIWIITWFMPSNKMLLGFNPSWIAHICWETLFRSQSMSCFLPSHSMKANQVNCRESTQGFDPISRYDARMWQTFYDCLARKVANSSFDCEQPEDNQYCLSRSFREMQWGWKRSDWVWLGFDSNWSWSFLRASFQIGYRFADSWDSRYIPLPRVMFALFCLLWIANPDLWEAARAKSAYSSKDISKRKPNSWVGVDKKLSFLDSLSHCSFQMVIADIRVLPETSKFCTACQTNRYFFMSDMIVRWVFHGKHRNHSSELWTALLRNVGIISIIDRKGWMT